MTAADSIERGRAVWEQLDGLFEERFRRLGDAHYPAVVLIPEQRLRELTAYMIGKPGQAYGDTRDKTQTLPEITISRILDARTGGIAEVRVGETLAVIGDEEL